MLTKVSIPTPDGLFSAQFSSRGLARLEFPERRARNRDRAGSRRTAPPEVPPEWIDLTRDALLAVLAAQPLPSLAPLDLSSATPFQRRVWHELLRIGPGRTRTYGDIARAIGRPRAVRAIGGACGANPIPVLIPCHRVLPKSGGLGGFSGGTHWKKILLAREGQSAFPARHTPSAAR